jgi:hypothetical protein
MHFNFIDLKAACESKSFIYEVLRRNHLLNEEGSVCNACNDGVLLIQNRINTPTGKVLRCNNRGCRKHRNIVKESVLNGNKVSKILFLSGAFIKNKTIASIIDDTNLNEKTVYKYFNIFRKICSEKISEENVVLGGPDIEVEIDETHLFCRKYNRGRILAYQHIWVFGIMERISKKIYLEVVPQRSGNCLFNIVNSHLARGSKVYSDSWAGYNIIKNHYNVLSVNHKLYFVDPNNNNIHTNNIERVWRILKNDLRGSYNENYEIHLKEFMFRRNFLTGNFLEDFDFFIKLFG